MSNNVTKENVDIPIEHPLEKVFGIEQGTTMLPTVQRTTELAVVHTYDEKDKEVEGQFQEVYDAAMGAFETQSQETELVEGKYKARSGEVAVQFLNTALAAAQSKSTLKQHKDKLSTVVNKAPGTVNNNLIVADRNDLLRNLRNMNLDKDVIDATIVEG
jgi:hypothetical protein